MKIELTNNELKNEIDYPWRANLLTVARCGYCKWHDEAKYTCSKGHEIKGPTQVNEHDCKDYEYLPCNVPMPEEGYIFMFLGQMKKREECNDCGYLFQGRCSGINWYPFAIKQGKCEFFRSKNKTCKFAIPRLQYGDLGRNNFCKLAPEQRDGGRGWKWNCRNAHTENGEYKTCYQPIKDE